MAKRYQHLSPTFLLDAVCKLDGVFGEFRYPVVTSELGAANIEPVNTLE
jgi:hypothetical protein